MSTQRQSIVISLTIQFDNGFQSPQWGALSLTVARPEV